MLKTKERKKLIYKKDYIDIIFQVYGDKSLNYLTNLRDALSVLISFKYHNGGNYEDFIDNFKGIIEYE